MPVAMAVDGEPHLLEAQTNIRRPGIALIPWLIRLWTQLSDAPTREWTRPHAGFWDQAVEGSSALKVAPVPPGR